MTSKTMITIPKIIAAVQFSDAPDIGGQVVVSVVASVATCGVVPPVMTDPVPIAPVVVKGTPTREDYHYHLSSTGQ
jgi:hypothetical protein